MRVVKVAIFGASGATGRELVSCALARGVAVTAVAHRHPERLSGIAPTGSVAVVDVANAADVEAALHGHDAVLSALGVGTPLRPDPRVVSGVRHLVSAMERHGPRRLISLSTLGIGSSRAILSPLQRFFQRFVIRHEIADHALKEAAIESSALEWTIVQAPKLTNGKLTRRYRAGVDIATGSWMPTLSRADVADFMLDELAAPRFVRSTVRLLP